MKHNLSQYHRGDSIIVVDKDGKEYQGVIKLAEQELSGNGET